MCNHDPSASFCVDHCRNSGHKHHYCGLSNEAQTGEASGSQAGLPPMPNEEEEDICFDVWPIPGWCWEYCLMVDPEHQFCGELCSRDPTNKFCKEHCKEIPDHNHDYCGK